MAEPARHFTAKTLATRWAVSTTKIYDMIGAGKLPALKIDGNLRIPQKFVEDFELCHVVNINALDTGLSETPEDIGKSAGPRENSPDGFQLAQRMKMMPTGSKTSSSRVVVLPLPPRRLEP